MKIKKAFVFLGGLLAAGLLYASTVVYNQNMVNEPALAYGTRFTIDLKTAGRNHIPIDTFSAQAVYSSATVSAVTFTDGGKSTGQITVTSNTGIIGVKATDQITVTSTSTIKNAVITINGKNLRQGYDWFIKSNTSTTATDIARILDKVEGIDASAAGGVVYATATTVGIAGNSYTLTKTAAAGLTIAGATFSGGVDNAYVRVNGVTLTQGTSWTAGASAALTAKAISDAIMANSSLTAVLVSTHASGIVYATSTAAGVNAYALVGYPSNKLTVSAAAMAGGTAPAWSLNSPTITKASHGLYTGLPVLYTTGTVAIGGLTNATTYYAIRVDANSFKLATSTTNAVAGTYVTLTSSSTAGPHTYTLTSLPITGTFGFKWQYSNDGTNWIDMSVSSVTFATPYTAGTTSWNFGTVGYRYLSVSETAGTAGALNLVISGYGSNNN